MTDREARMIRDHLLGYAAANLRRAKTAKSYRSKLGAKARADAYRIAANLIPVRKYIKRVAT